MFNQVKPLIWKKASENFSCISAVSVSHLAFCSVFSFWPLQHANPVWHMGFSPPSNSSHGVWLWGTSHVLPSDTLKWSLSSRSDCCCGLRPHLPAGGDGQVHVQAQGHLPHQRGQRNRVRRKRRCCSQKWPRSPGSCGWEQKGVFHLRGKDFHGDFPKGINQKYDVNRSTKRWIIWGYRRAS